METWRGIPGFDGYEVSDLGRVRSYWAAGRNGGTGNWHLSSRPQRILRPQPNGSGYLRVLLVGESESVRYAVHHLVLLAFDGPPPTPRHQTNHLDGDKTNNALSNLAWATCSENMKHSFDELGREPVSGEQNGNARLDWPAVCTIREMYASGNHTTRSLAPRFGVSQATIWRVVTGQTWNSETGGAGSTALDDSAVPSSASPVFAL